MTRFVCNCLSKSRSLSPLYLLACQSSSFFLSVYRMEKATRFSYWMLFLSVSKAMLGALNIFSRITAVSLAPKCRFHNLIVLFLATANWNYFEYTLVLGLESSSTSAPDILCWAAKNHFPTETLISALIFLPSLKMPGELDTKSKTKTRNYNHPHARHPTQTTRPIFF